MRSTRRAWLASLLTVVAVPVVLPAESAHLHVRQYWNDFVRSFNGWERNLETLQSALKEDKPFTQSIDTIHAAEQCDSVFKKLCKVWRRLCGEIL